MPRLIWVFAGSTVTLLVLSCCGSYYTYFCLVQFSLVLSCRGSYHTVPMQTSLTKTGLQQLAIFQPCFNMDWLWFLLNIIVRPLSFCDQYMLVLFRIALWPFAAKELVCWLSACAVLLYAVLFFLFLSLLVFGEGCGIRLHRFLNIVFSSVLYQMNKWNLICSTYPCRLDEV